jgi:predicted GTPase
MKTMAAIRRYWPEALLTLAIALPWLALLVLGMMWLWEGDRFWWWALGAAILGLLTWPLSWFVRRRANAEARLALGDVALPPPEWHVNERDAWSDVLAIADATAPFSFIEVGPPLLSAQATVETVARRFHPQAQEAWAQFSLPEVLLLAERLSRDIRHEALSHIPGVRTLRLSHLIWVHRQHEHFGGLAWIGWRTGSALWRVVRAVFNPLQAAGQEASGALIDKAATVLSYRLRAYATRLFVLEVGRAAIDLYSGRLKLSAAELLAAQARDASGMEEPVAPVRIVLIGQVSVGKSSLVNALAGETRCAIGPVPTTARVGEYLLEVEGQPAVSIVDMPGLGDRAGPDVLTQVARADLILWVASAVQPARGPDRKKLDEIRAWVATQPERRPPPLLLALTHVDELRPASEWVPPYDIVTPVTPKACAMRSAVEAVGRALDLPIESIVPIAMPPDRKPYNIDALWARIAVELDEAKFVQLDRLRRSEQATNLREFANQLGQAGRFIVKGVVKAR